MSLRHGRQESGDDLETLSPGGNFEQLQHDDDYEDEETPVEKKIAFAGKKDYWADLVLNQYLRLQMDAMLPVKAGFLFGGPVSIVAFYLFVSSSMSNMIAFSAMVIALTFMGIAMYMLGWILDKDIGPRSMQEIAEPIKEGSEGFFMTQYGTIFKFAFGTAIGLFGIYYVRDPIPGSELNNYLSVTGMAVIMATSFLCGAGCSAIAGYSGIWVSVRANLRVAAASRNDYNAAM